MDNNDVIEEAERMEKKKFTEADEEEMVRVMRTYPHVHNIIMLFSLPIRKEMEYLRRRLDTIDMRLEKIEKNLKNNL